MIRCLKSARSQDFSPVHNILNKSPCKKSNGVIESVELITHHLLINTWQELEYRLYICRATTGAHIEVYGRA